MPLKLIGSYHININVDLKSLYCKMHKPVLSLKQFMLRQEVLKLYRETLSVIRKIPDQSSRNELREWVRTDFKNNKHHTEEITIKMLINQGKRSLMELRSNLELSGIRTS